MGTGRTQVTAFQFRDPGFHDGAALAASIEPRPCQGAKCRSSPHTGTRELAARSSIDVAGDMGRVHDPINVAVKTCSGFPADATKFGSEIVCHEASQRSVGLGCTLFFAFRIQDGVMNMWRFQGDGATLTS